MFLSVLIAASFSLSSISGFPQIIDSVNPLRSIVDTGSGGGGTSDFIKTCSTSPGGVDMCWGRWGA